MTASPLDLKALAPAPPATPANEVIREAELPRQDVVEAPPTHVVWRDDGFELVHLGGYSDTAALEPLPDGFWDMPMKADPAARTFAPDLEGARAAKWEEVKARRAELEFGVAPTPLGPIQCDDSSKLKLSGLDRMAEKAAKLGEPFSDSFTLANNEVITLTAQSLDILGLAVGRYVSKVYAVGRALRARIEAEDATVESLLAIDVSAEFEGQLADLHEGQA